MLYLDKLKHKVSKILAFTIVIYGICIIVLYQYYQDKAEIEKAQILQGHYNKIAIIAFLMFLKNHDFSEYTISNCIFQRTLKLKVKGTRNISK